MKATTKRYSSNRNEQMLCAEARRLIEEQTAAFLELGGRIQHIPNGVSGHTYGAEPRPIALAKPKLPPG